MVGPTRSIGASDDAINRDPRSARADADTGRGIDRVATVAAGLAASPANPAGAPAQSAATKPQDLFTQIDTNQNGALSEAELEAARPRQPSPGARLSGDLMVALFRQQERQVARVEPTPDRSRQWLDSVQRLASPSPAAARMIASA